MIATCFTFLALSIATDAAHLGASCPQSGEAHLAYCKCLFAEAKNKLKWDIDPSQCTSIEKETDAKADQAMAPTMTKIQGGDFSLMCPMYSVSFKCDKLHCEEKASKAYCEKNINEMKTAGVTCSYDCNAPAVATGEGSKKTAAAPEVTATATPKVTTTTTTTTKTVAVVEFAITGVDLTDLDDKAQEGLKTDLAAGLSEELGVPANKITVTLEAGSIKTKAEVETSNPKAVETKMTTGGKDLTTQLVKSSATLKKAVEASGGSMDDIGASAPVVTTVTYTPPPPTTAAPAAVAAHASHSLPSLAALVLGAGLLVVAA